MDQSFDFEGAAAPVREAGRVAGAVMVLAAFQAWILGRLRRHGGHAAVESPTGSGKTLMVRALVGLDLGRAGGFTHALVAAPQEQIERGFLRDHDMVITWPEGTAAQPRLHVPATLFRAARSDGCGTRVSIRRYLAGAGARGYALACTHAALTTLRPDDLPDDLTGRVLIIDEAHHVCAVGLARVARLWRERGGRLLLVTATPYRSDGQPVILPDMVHLRRSLAEHMEEGWAPRTLASEIVALGSKRQRQRVSTAQLTGEAAPPSSYSRPTVEAIVSKWEQDGRPKTIVRVPPGRGDLVGALVRALERAGARVLDATGVERERKRRFLGALDAERERSAVTSTIDVIVGIQRVLEGTDWPHCAAVYSIGIPRSLHVVVQLAGHALRRKPQDYPEAYRDLARLVFFVPCAGGEAVRELSIEHSRHVLMTCAFMADHVIGQAWVVTAAVRRALHGALDDRPEALDDALETASALAHDPQVLAEVQLALAAAREELVEEGIAPTPGAVLEAAGRTRPDLPEDVVRSAMVEVLAREPGTLGEQVRGRLEAVVTDRVRIDPQIQEAMRVAFSSVLAEFRDATLERSALLEAMGRQVHTLTGGAMREFAARLAAAHPRPLTVEQVLAWADAHREATGAWPSAKSGVVRMAPDETWIAIDSALRVGNRSLPAVGSLPRLLQEHRGAVDRSAPGTLTPERILTWARAHHGETGAWPTRDSGRIAGTPFTWGAVNLALIRGRHGLQSGSSLPRLLQTIGAKYVRRQPPLLTETAVAECARRFHARHGRWPTRKDGTVDAPPGETWMLIESAVTLGRRGLTRRGSLASFCHDLCGAPPPGSVRRELTVERILEWARAYHARTGTWPKADTIDPELPPDETWSRVSRALDKGGRGLPRTSLVKLLTERLGVRNPRRPGPLCKEQIWAWACAHRDRTGSYPDRDSGPVHAAPGEVWKLIDESLKYGYRGLSPRETLRKLVQRMQASR